MNNNSIEQYKEYLTGHIGNVGKALEVLFNLDIPYIKENIDKLREIVKEHDASKYEEPEWSAYLHHFYPENDEEKMMEEEFDNATLHHIKNNKHHWNYWVDEENNLIDDIDEEEYKLYTIERICDWLAMAAQHEEGPTEYWEANKDFVVQPDYAKSLCDEIFNKVPEDFGKDMWKITRGELDEDFLPMNKEYVKSLGKRVKRSKTSNTIEIDTQMTNHDKQLKEMEVEYPKNYKDIIKYEYINPEGYYMIDLKDGWEDPAGNSYIMEKTKREAYRILKQCTKVVTKKLDEATGNISKAEGCLIALGCEYEKYMSYKTIDFKITGPSHTREFYDKIFRTLKNNLGTDNFRLLNYGIEGFILKVLPGHFNESVLNEMKLSQIKQKSKNQDPARIAKSRNVKTTYIGMSVFGILNFKTTSETRNGYHYQTIEFKDMKPFEDIVKAGRDVKPDDIKKNLKEQDVNIWCTDESFAFWAWAHQAYKNDFLYIDDRIPNLKKAIQAPKINNVRLNGGACKHILSVIDYVMKPFVLLAIADDMNKYLSGTGEDKMQKQDVATQNQYDQVADWDWSDIEETLGKSRIEIMSDISKTLQIIPNIDIGDIITDFVGELLPQEEQGLKREIVDRIEQLAEDKDKNKK